MALLLGGLAARLANQRLIAFVGLLVTAGYLVLTSSVSHSRRRRRLLLGHRL